MSTPLSSQTNQICQSKKLIVAAEDLNFRNGPSTDSKSIGKLNNSEKLTLLEIIGEEYENYWNDYSNSWIKVERDSTKEEGYVFGKYVKSQEMAYINYHDSDRLQPGNWYGIYKDKDKDKVKIEKANPEIEVIDEGYKSIKSDEKHKIIICTQDKFEEGQLNAKLFDFQSKYLKIGDQIRLLQIDNVEYSLVCTGEVSLNKGWILRKNEKIILLKTEIIGSNRKYTQQDLSDCIHKYGEIGYKIHFAGDLNKDKVPELIISEGSTKGGTVYYFISNKNGELELKSTTGISSKC